MPSKADSKPAPPDPRRQKTLDQVLGNEPARHFLRRAWRAGRLPQALLFHGPAGIGKTTTAWALAREIVARDQNPDADPRALKIARGVHFDMFEITGKSSISSAITVDEIRETSDRLYTAPLESPRKIVIIDPADRMNTQASNALLKMLEEPPSLGTFILITAEANRLLPTIRSRCTPLRFEPVPIDELAPWLAQTSKLAPDQARLIATLSEGSPGTALALARTGMMEKRKEILAALTFYARQGFAAIFAVAERIAKAGGESGEVFAVATTLLRDALIINTRGEGVLNIDLIEELRAFAAERTPEGLLEAAQICERAGAELPYFYGPGAKGHFIEHVLIETGRALRA